MNLDDAIDQSPPRQYGNRKPAYQAIFNAISKALVLADGNDPDRDKFTACFLKHHAQPGVSREFVETAYDEAKAAHSKGNVGVWGAMVEARREVEARRLSHEARRYECPDHQIAVMFAEGLQQHAGPGNDFAFACSFIAEAADLRLPSGRWDNKAGSRIRARLAADGLIRRTRSVANGTHKRPTDYYTWTGHRQANDISPDAGEHSPFD